MSLITDNSIAKNRNPLYRRILEFCFLFFTIALICYSCSKDEVATDQLYSFIKFYGIGSYNEGNDIVQLTDNDYLLFGTCTTSDSGTDMFLTRTDQYGDEIWRRNIGTKSNEKGYCMKLMQDENLVMLGTVEVGNITEGKTNIVLLKTNPTGDSVLWKRLLVSDTSMVGYEMQVTSSGEFIIAGTAVINAKSHAILIKTNPLGYKTEEYIVGYASSCKDLIVGDNSVVMIGTADYDVDNPFITTDVSQVFMVNTDGNLSLKASYFSGSSSAEKGECIKLLPDGNYICLSDSADRLCLSKFRNDINEHLVKVWQKEYSDIEISENINLEITSDNEYLIACTNNSANDKDIFILKVDSTGTEIAQTRKTYKGDGNQTSSKIIKTSEGGYAIIGNNEYSGYSVISLMKIKVDGGF
jgi:hypothetical protein